MSKITKTVLFAIFFMSGAVSLIFEVLWIRVLSLGVGSTSTSMSVVLSIFFLGLGLGSFLAGRHLSTVKRPLLVYGLLEAFAGLYGVGLIFVLINFQHLLSWTTAGSNYGPLLLGMKILLVGILLIAPTLCMGASLPLLTKVLASEEKTLGKSIGLLYGLNTLGAVFGALITSFFLIPVFGILVANHIAAACGVLIFIAAAYVQLKVLSRQTPLSAAAELDANAEIKIKSTHVTEKHPWVVRVVLMVCAVSGLSSISAQVVWNKYLSIFFGTNIYGIGLTLSVFLLGLAVGSIIASRYVDKLKNRLVGLFTLLIASVVAMIFSSYALDMAPLAAAVLAAIIPGTANLLLVKCVVAGLIVFVPTSIFGAIFPLCVKIITQRVSDAPQRIGQLYSFNTVGSIIGSCIAGLVLIPHLGSTITIRIAALFLALAAISVGVVIDAAPKIRWARFAVAAAMALLAISLNGIHFKNIIKSAYFQNLAPGTKVSDVIRDFNSNEEEFKLIIEGANGVISLSHDTKDGAAYRDYLRLKTSGLNESIYNTKDLSRLPKYEALLGFIPYAYRPAPKNAFVVGFGGGYTVDFMTSLPIKTVVVAELEPGILEAAKYARGADASLFTRKNLQLEIEDARFLLASNQENKFDMIVSQPSHSWLVGAANLFTREFFTIVSKKLSDHGVYSQWLNLYNMDPETLKSIFATFFSVFEHGVILTDKDDHELILLGSNAPLTLNLERINAMLKDQNLVNQLKDIPVGTASDFLSLIVMDREAAVKLSAGATINTDLNAYAETRQSRIFYEKTSSIEALQRLMHSNFNAGAAVVKRGTQLNHAELEALIESTLRLKKYDKFQPLFDQYERQVLAERTSRIQAGIFAVQAERYATAAEHFESELKLKPTSKALEGLGSATIQAGEFKKFLEVAEKFRSVRSEISDCYKADAIISLKERSALQESFLNQMIAKSDLYRKKCGLYFDKIAGAIYFLRGKDKNAKESFERYYAAYGEDSYVVGAMIGVYVKLQEWANAKAFAAYLPGIVEKRKRQLLGLAEIYEARGYAADVKVLRTRAAAYDL